MGKAAVTGYRGATQSRLWSHRGNGGGMSAQEIGRNTGNPSGGCVTQPDAREGQAGPYGVSERSIVPLRPANAGGGKGPQFKANVRSSREPGDWRESNTSTKGSEAAGDVACQSEESARLSVLCAVRQAVSSRRPGLRLRVLPGQPGSPGSR